MREIFTAWHERRIKDSGTTTDIVSVRAITIKPLWAWAITNGGKRIENRSWSTKYRGPILIHAGIARDADAESRLREILPHRTIPAYDEVIRGAVVAKATLVGVVIEGHDSYLDFRHNRLRRLPRNQEKWFDGPFAFVLDDLMPVQPVPLRGRLSIFNPGPLRLRALK